ncbi:hypothetical protein RFI_21769 [Reticulomyxa filosa]|uniref:Glutamine cyclotransferase n=1 Tax=Reticulomyxa filosa TaxID=46433 RepID=X6MQ85_RETFI|nr:hypothetical protein RFI_21769 [Reticulomyxa filosa]|eukprot:ETO15597.1 hypothetical protein RFI_21769 [Reticulomyxa filosa]
MDAINLKKRIYAKAQPQKISCVSSQEAENTNNDISSKGQWCDCVYWNHTPFAVVLFGTGQAQQHESSKHGCMCGSKHTGLQLYQEDAANTQTLIESVGLYGQSKLSIYKYKDEIAEDEELELIRSVDLPKKVFGEGATIYNGQWLYVLTWRERRVFVYDIHTLNLKKELKLPKQMREGWGLFYDDLYFHKFLATDGSDNVFFIDPSNFSVTHKITVQMKIQQFKHGSQQKEIVQQSVTNLNELEVIHGWIVANIWHKKFIAIISPFNGYVYAILNCTHLYPRVQNSPEAVLNGIAYNSRSKRLILSGKFWPYFYEVETPGILLGHLNTLQ